MVRRERQPHSAGITIAAAEQQQNGWINLMGLRVSAVDLEGATSLIFSAIEAGRREYVCIRDAHGVIRAQEDPHLRDAHNEAFLVTPDGMPLVWALHRAGYHNAGRVYGPDLMLRIFDAGRERRLRHFLYGSTQEVLEGLQKRLSVRFPGAIIAGTFAPPFRQLDQDEETAVAERINRSRADVLWVGLGTPKQELWMQRMRERLEPAMLIGVGAAFDFHAGRIRQAPKILQRNGLEWLFRLICEPRRLWRRYASTIPRFVFLNAAQELGLKRFPEPPPRAANGVGSLP